MSLSTNDYVFYVVSTHEFFYTIELRSNRLHPLSTSSLQSSSISRQSQIIRSYIHKLQEIIFCYGRTNHSRRRGYWSITARRHSTTVHIYRAVYTAITAMIGTRTAIAAIALCIQYPTSSSTGTAIAADTKGKGEKKIHVFFFR